MMRLSFLPKGRLFKWGVLFCFSLLLIWVCLFFDIRGRGISACSQPFDYFQWKENELHQQKVIAYTFRKNDFLYELLVKKYQVPPSTAYTLIQSIKKRFSVKEIRPGCKLLLVFKNNRLQRCILCPHLSKNFIFSLTPLGIVSCIQTSDKHIFLAKAEGQIEGNLYNSALKNKIDPALVLELADIFAWDINFFTDIRSGDTYRFIYEKVYIDGQFVHYGRILAAEFVNQGETHKAFYFENPEGEGDYYNENGKSLRKAFLKAPLHYKRISSYFTYHRFHPILGIVRPHLGIDYAAPIGTPVRAIADGRIVYIGWRGGYGKFIKIQHNHIYASTYGHLSRFSKGLRRGSRVRQGQVIGYVGMTGLATGPHLDFRFIKNGHFVNYLKFRSPAGRPLPQKLLPIFKKRVAKLEKLLNSQVRFAHLTLDEVIGNRFN